MKEIDFIPDWYRADQNRKRRHHRQYALLGVLLMLLVGWNFIIGHHVSVVRAEVEAVQSIIDSARLRVDDATLLQNEIADISRKTSELEAVAPRTKTSAVMAELSQITGDNIVLSKLTLSAEPIDTPQSRPAQKPGTVVQVNPAAQSKTDLGSAPLRTKVVLCGIAALPADAATLIYRLEQSDYFEQVVPVFTRAKTVREHEVTEFEIRCYVADYRMR
jgi:hypothetical protein